ncbi:ion channel [Psychroserpens luteolus]|uniref:ion channel n=1 Tax=Psychroserpens luteolus TaxID=2855840 RepID=UPI001E50609F|nr:ion channel [Psychroserpens luteolus]MCD2257795.1 potassium channel family protein [Psychroserpens luteolus]
MIKDLYKHRFEIFFATQLFILFGSLLFPSEFFENVLTPILFLVNTIAGIFLVSKKRKLMWFLIILFGISLVVFGSSMMNRQTEFQENFLIRLSVYFIFYIIVAHQIILQIWKAKRVNNLVVIGLMCGYISLGFIAFFLFTTIEIVEPNSFKGIVIDSTNASMGLDSIMYYSYITLMTIGYGDIVPVSPLAQKASLITGLMGQFYLVIVTAIVVGKYIQHNAKSDD